MVLPVDVHITSRAPGLLLMELGGVIGPGAVSQLRLRLDELIGTGRVPLSDLVVDLSNVRLCDCRLLPVLDAARCRLESARGRLEVRGLRPHTLAGFDEIGVADVLAAYRASLTMGRPQWPRERGWVTAPRRFSASERQLVGLATALAVHDVPTSAAVAERLVGWCVSALGGQAAVVLLDGEQASGGVAVVCASGERARLAAVAGVGIGEGPVVDCLQRGEPVGVPDLDGPGGPWPRYAREMRRHDVRAVRALPLRVPEPVDPGMSTTVGALVLMSAVSGAMAPTDLQLLAAVADLAGGALARSDPRGVPVYRGRALRDAVPATSTDGQVVIERAVGVLAERERLTPSQARARLLRLAAERDTDLGECARRVVDSAGVPAWPAGVR